MAAAVEGESSLMVLTIREGKLALHHRIGLSNTLAPTSLALDSQGNLWAAGGCRDQSPFQSGFVQGPIMTAVRFLFKPSQEALKFRQALHA